MKRLIVLIAVLAIGLMGLASLSSAIHVDVPLKDRDGNLVAGTTNPYSPKTTCGTTSCHDSIATDEGLSGNIYESDVAYAVKDHGTGSPSYGSPYSVPYPLHGVTAGYHFQQGLNHSYGDRQRSFYGLASFTSSAGMYGKY